MWPRSSRGAAKRVATKPTSLLFLLDKASLGVRGCLKTFLYLDKNNFKAYMLSWVIILEERCNVTAPRAGDSFAPRRLLLTERLRAILFPFSDYRNINTTLRPMYLANAPVSPGGDASGCAVCLGLGLGFRF
jgi:hypothetical protein